ncbi:metalloregulator ArsR/SmtB family transcription factor [Hyphomicrobium sp.]|uniref:ArsR/SmtB family transcription factor n=1 Tax=unclassified Hyphomicrobium TaxID=2619925 RepID=UPI000F96860E|nr:metalloregulator ArsR/SmtB family transcription factor [Hyphomicrobium sp.]RUP08621.1 MAG: transcriptional regulator [Hyphomicrobium sp.]
MVEHRSKHLDDVFQALSDPTRRAIIGMLAQRPHTVTELMKPFPFTLNAISKHIKALEKAGLIDREIQGRIHLCSLNTQPMNEAYDWLGSYEKFWAGSLDKLEKLLKNKAKPRNGKRS